MPVQQVQTLLQQGRRISSLDLKVEEQEATTLGALVQDDGMAPEEFVEQSLLIQELRELFNRLPLKH